MKHETKSPFITWEEVEIDVDAREKQLVELLSKLSPKESITLEDIAKLPEGKVIKTMQRGLRRT